MEHNATDIYVAQLGVLMEALARLNLRGSEIAAIGVTNQRETVVAWDRETGLPVCNAIVWQCRRTADACEALLQDEALVEKIRAKTGLLVDAYFSATKLRWILDNVPGAREKAEAGRLLAGTIDSWLIWKLTDGRAFVTDVTNASRTMLFNIHTMQWDEELLELFGIPASILPEVRSCSEVYGTMDLAGAQVPICGLAGDQQAALFGQTCFEKGDVKNTYGTGNFILMNTGETPVESRNGLLTTVACRLGGRTTYALEGSVFVGGAVLQWPARRDALLQGFPRRRLFRRPREGFRRRRVRAGVHRPGRAALGHARPRHALRPHARHHAQPHHPRGAGSHRLPVEGRHRRHGGRHRPADPEIKVDGGASVSDIIMQFQADITGKRLRRPIVRETTALGAAYLAGLAVGFWRSLDEVRDHWTIDRVYEPSMTPEQREESLRLWKAAVWCAREFGRRTE